MKAAEKKVIELCLKKHIAPRAEIESIDQAKFYLDMGVRHFCMATDIRIIFNFLRQNGEALRKAIEKA